MSEIAPGRLHRSLVFWGGLVVMIFLLCAWGDSLDHAMVIQRGGCLFASDASALYLEYDSRDAGTPLGFYREGASSDSESHLPGLEWEEAGGWQRGVIRLPYPVLFFGAVIAWAACLAWWWVRWRRMNRALGQEGGEE